MLGIFATLLAASISMASVPTAVADEGTGSNTYREHFIPPERTPQLHVEDHYENNNTLDTAVCMTPDSYLSSFLYTSEAHGVLERKSYSGDLDNFYIKCMTDTPVHVRVSAEQPIHLAVRQYNYEIFQTNDESSYEFLGNLNHQLSWIYESDEDTVGNVQTVDFLAKAGTYFISLDYLSTGAKPSKIQYDLTVSTDDYQWDGYEGLNMEDAMFNKRLAGAMWLNDIPFNNCAAVLQRPSTIAYHHDSQANIASPEYYLDDLYEYAKDQPLELARYYLWDEDLISAIRKVATDLINYLAALKQDIELRNKEITVTFNAAEKTLTVTAEYLGIAGAIVPNPLVSIFTTVASYSLDAVAAILERILPCLLTSTSTVEAYRRTFINLASALEKSEDQIGYRVIEIPVYYKMRKEDYSALPKGPRSVIDTSVTGDILADNFNWIRDNHTDDCVRKIATNVFQRGRFYGFKFQEDPQTPLRTAPIADFSDVVHEDKPLKVDVPSSIYAYRGDYALCSFTAEKAGTYCVELPYESSNERLELATFSSAPIGYTDEGMLQSDVGGMLNNSHSVIGAHLDVELAEGEKVYFRVKNGEYARFQPVSIEVRSTPIEHHDNITYQWKTNRQHWKRCGCGYQKLEGHFVSSSNQKVCVFCHGTASMGFIGGGNRALGVNQEFGHGSYLRADGIYVISDEDMPSLLAGTLDYPNKA